MFQSIFGQCSKASVYLFLLQGACVWAAAKKWHFFVSLSLPCLFCHFSLSVCLSGSLSVCQSSMLVLLYVVFLLLSLFLLMLFFLHYLTLILVYLTSFCSFSSLFIISSFYLCFFFIFPYIDEKDRLTYNNNSNNNNNKNSGDLGGKKGDFSIYETNIIIRLSK